MTDRPMFNPGAVNTAPLNPQPKPVEQDRPLFDPAAAVQKIEQAKADEQSLWTKPLGPLKTWSFSGLMTFEGCPYRSYLTKVEGAREPSGPAADRGSKLHEAIENYIQGIEADLSKDVLKHRELITDLREHYAQGDVEVEGDWGFTRDWVPTGWRADDVWARLKLDAIHFESETSAAVYDWKSGKKFGNEIKHATQLMTYAIGAFMRYPKLEFVYGAMKYIDKGETLEGKYTRADVGMFKPKIEKRALIMTTADDFPPRPSKHNCKWCKLKEPLEGEETARCQWGVIE